MNSLSQLLGKIYTDGSFKPMSFYLQERAGWLDLSQLTKNKDEQIALASLGSLNRLFTPQGGKALFSAFLQLSKKIRKAGSFMFC
ncbi:hypothetical protein CI610_02020 [invertebrate metagenome]|uniref:Uncharacterized protein n=1 Tax=invertebrate metagenome TaxID=1711999 RepID=A0A2H9T724_9ZZZZ